MGNLAEEIRKSGKVTAAASRRIADAELYYARNGYDKILIQQTRAVALHELFHAIANDFPEFAVTMNVSIESRKNMGETVFVARAEIVESFDSLRERYYRPASVQVLAPHPPPVSKLARWVDRVVKAVTRSR